jgi:Secretion system C-terminal sorting domain
MIDFRKTGFLIFIFLIGSLQYQSFSQVVLEADGPGETYELINSVFAPGYNAVESAECVHPEFGRHIAEVWDEDLKQYVFEFYIHVTPDNDRCLYFDRQRVEIKTYESSPANLKGIAGETVIYKWKFKIPYGFQPSSSFTHIHQVKAVGGDDGMPIFTLTPRAGNPDKVELIHNNTTKVVTVPLSLFEGIWVEATEKIKIDSQHGTYSMTIKKISDSTAILTYNNYDLMTIRADNSFIRPKWGIYRSLNDSSALRDESLRFASFSIEEVQPNSSKLTQENGKAEFHIYPNPASTRIYVEYYLTKTTDVNLVLYGINGLVEKTIISHEIQTPGKYQNNVDVSGLQNGLYFIRMSSANFIQTEKLMILR